MKVIGDHVGELEELVDQWGISFLLATLEQVCHEKADHHITKNWQDPALAEAWENVGKNLDRVESTLPECLQ